MQEGLGYGEDSVNPSEPKTCINSTMKVLQGLRKLYIERNKPYIAMIFTQFVCAGMSLLSKAAVTEGMNPYIFIVYRLALATITLAPFEIMVNPTIRDPTLLSLTCVRCKSGLTQEIYMALPLYRAGYSSLASHRELNLRLRRRRILQS